MQTKLNRVLSFFFAFALKWFSLHVVSHPSKSTPVVVLLFVATAVLFLMDGFLFFFFFLNKLPLLIIACPFVCICLFMRPACFCVQAPCEYRSSEARAGASSKRETISNGDNDDGRQALAH